MADDGGARTTRLLLATRFVRSIGQGCAGGRLRSVSARARLVRSGHQCGAQRGADNRGSFDPVRRAAQRSWWPSAVPLFAYEAAQTLAGVVALLSAQPVLLGAAAMVGGFGRGGNGGAGPFAPVEQAWLAQAVTPMRRGPVYSLNAALGFLGNAVGAILAAVPSSLHTILPGPLAYRPLFLLSAVGSLLCCALILRTPDSEARQSLAPTAPTHPHGVQRQENRLVLRLMIANLLNGAGVGATGPLIAYWFAVRFGEGPAEIGPLMAGGFLMAAVASVATGWLSNWLGMVRAVIAMRLVGLALLIALPLSPNFGLAAVLYILRAMFNRGTTGARSALSISIVRPHRRGFSASMANVSMQIPRSVSPVLTGILFAANNLVLPFFIGAAFQGAYLAMYYVSFRQVDDAMQQRHGTDPQVTVTGAVDSQPSL